MIARDRRDVVIAVAVLALTLGIAYWLRDPVATLIPDSTRVTLDSLDRTAPEFDSVVTAALAAAEHRVASADRLRRTAQEALRRADRERGRADSLAAVAGLSADSGAVWRQAYEARTLEAAGVRLAFDSVAAALDTVRVALDSTRAVADLALARLDVTSGVVVELRAALARGDACRVGPRVASLPCPSRRQAFIVGAIVGGVAGVVLLRR